MGELGVCSLAFNKLEGILCGVGGNFDKKVYVAHPYGQHGDRLDNYVKVEGIITQLAIDNPNTQYISPIHSSSFLYDVYTYEVGIEQCYNMLIGCDVLLLTGEWWHSKGCGLEKDFAEQHGIEIQYMTLPPAKEDVECEHCSGFRMYFNYCPNCGKKF